MSRRRKSKSTGFNSPFAGLELPAEPTPAPQAPPPPEPEPDGDALFLQAMGGAKRLESADRIEPPKTTAAKLVDEDSEVVAELERLVNGQSPFTLEDAGDVLKGKAPGVNDRTLKDLVAGKYAYRDHIDLHGFTREAAKEELKQFIIRARRDDRRCVLVVTGRGKSSPTGVSVLRESLPRWLSRRPLSSHVLAFATARREHGGPGAFYVLLRRAGVRPFGESE